MTKHIDITKKETIDLLQERGVNLNDIAKLTMFAQYQYFPNLTPQLCLEAVQKVLDKREVRNTIFTGINIDKNAEKNYQAGNNSNYQQIMNIDDGLYGLDEVLTMGILGVYGFIALTDFGYLDRMKPGILAKLNRHKPGEINVYLDDIVAALASAAAAKIANQQFDLSQDKYNNQFNSNINQITQKVQQENNILFQTVTKKFDKEK